MDYRELSGFGLLDPLQEHYVTSYHAAELKTFHCERVRKMPLSGLDPSMLIGFLCKDEADWRDFRRRVVELPRTVFSVQDEPPTWPSDSDDNMGLESISEPDDAEINDEGEEVGEVGDEDGEGEQFFDTRSGSPSTSSAGASGSHHEAGRSERGNSEEVDTEEDPVDPITPGPNSRFSIRIPLEGKMDETVNEGGDFVLEDDDEPPFEGGDIEDDWVDPSISSPATARSSSIPVNDLPPPAVVHAAVSTPIKRNGSAKKGKKGKKRGEVPVPVPLVKIPSRYPQEHLPFPVTAEDHHHPQDPSHDNSTKSVEMRMHTARARDGGRTQSGGVKGVITEN
jgi:cysteine protease ATG4